VGINNIKHYCQIPFFGGATNMVIIEAYSINTSNKHHLHTPIVYFHVFGRMCIMLPSTCLRI